MDAEAKQQAHEYRDGTTDAEGARLADTRLNIRLLALRSAPQANPQAEDSSSDDQEPEPSSDDLDTADNSDTSDSAPAQVPAPDARRNVFFSSAQFTPDGTSIMVKTSDRSVQTHVLPENLLQPSSDEPQALHAHGQVDLPEPTQVVTPAPYYSLAEPSTQTFLVGCHDHPIQLYHAFPNSGASAPWCSYRLAKQETEAFITPSSLLWEASGTHFLCGSKNRLDYFDVARYGSDGPILTIPTIPSTRHIRKDHGIGMKGTVSALAASSDSTGSSLVAAGTWTRWIGLYDVHRTDKTVANWSIIHAEKALGTGHDLEGRGIVQLAWSPCGRYLVVNERHAEGLMVYDVRVSGQLLTILRGRKTTSQQTLGCGVFWGDAQRQGFEVWGGTDDGVVCVWEEVGMTNDAIEPTWNWQAHEAPVGSTLLHSSGSVAATCAGGWAFSNETDQDVESMTTRGGIDVFEESSLKVWFIGGSEPTGEAAEGSTEHWRHPYR